MSLDNALKDVRYYAHWLEEADFPASWLKQSTNLCISVDHGAWQ
jgi:hypothetical protein